MLISICGLLLRNDLKLLSFNLAGINTLGRNGIGRDSCPEEENKVQSGGADECAREDTDEGPHRRRVSEGCVCSTMLFT